MPNSPYGVDKPGWFSIPAEVRAHIGKRVHIAKARNKALRAREAKKQAEQWVEEALPKDKPKPK